MNVQQTRADVLDRLDDLREDSTRASRVHDHVDSAHESDCTPTDLLHVLRAAPDLALELRSSLGRHVIAAAEIAAGEYRYAVWHHSAVAAQAGGGPVRVQSWDVRSEVQTTLEGRDPRVRLRAETPLADLEVPGKIPPSKRGFAGP